MLTRKELVKRWGVTDATVVLWMKNKNLPYHLTATHRYWFDEKEIEEWEKKMGMPGKRD